MYLAKSEECTGCSACVNICPNNCITMMENFEGFLEPKINESICIKCGLCMKVCPVLNKNKKNNNNKFFACYAKDDNLLKKSSSGGVFGLIAREILKKDGIVYEIGRAHV